MNQVRTQLRDSIKAATQENAPKKRSFPSNAELILTYDPLCKDSPKKFRDNPLETDGSAYEPRMSLRYK